MIFFSLNDLPSSLPLPGYHLRVIHGERMSVAYWDIECGATLPEHSHPHEQIANVLEGEFELFVGGELRRLRSGDVAVIPPGVPHSGRALTDCRILDTFSPTREDYR